MLPLSFSSPKHKYCHIHGGPLGLKYTLYTLPGQTTDLVVCEECERTAPRCTLHNHPAAAQTLTTVDREQVCPPCLGQLPRCAACGKPIIGQFYHFGDSPRRYCPICCKERPPCGICGAPIGKDGKKLAGGEIRCGACAQTIVLDDKDIEALYRAVIFRVNALVGNPVKHEPALQIVGRDQLMTIRSKHRNVPPSLGDAGQHVLGFFEQIGGKRTIYIERGLPRSIFISTLAHEYTHAWQADYALQEQTMLRREGFAEWIGYHMLLALGYTLEAEHAAERARDRKDVYGQGLRYFIDLEQQFGRQRVLSEARS